jgi:hypothetical protein
MKAFTGFQKGQLLYILSHFRNCIVLYWMRMGIEVTECQVRDEQVV